MSGEGVTRAHIPRSVFGPAKSFPNFCSLIVSLSGGSKKSSGPAER